MPLSIEEKSLWSITAWLTQQLWKTSATWCFCHFFLSFVQHVRRVPSFPSYVFCSVYVSCWSVFSFSCSSSSYFSFCCYFPSTFVLLPSGVQIWCIHATVPDPWSVMTQLFSCPCTYKISGHSCFLHWLSPSPDISLWRHICRAMSSFPRRTQLHQASLILSAMCATRSSLRMAQFRIEFIDLTSNV